MKSRLLALATWLLASGCATVPPEQAERDAVVIKAARACQLSHPGVHITGVDQYGRLKATYQASNEWAGFRVCFQAELKRLMGTTEFGAGRLVVPPSGPSPTTVPLELTGSVFLVRAMVDGTYPVTLLLDTGASLTIVRPQALAAARVEVSRVAPKILGTVVGGQTVSMPYVRLRSLTVGNATVESIDVAAYDATPHSRDVDGLLGGNFLNHFTVTIDRASKLLTLTPSGVVPGAPAAPASDRVWEAPVWTAGDEWRTQWRTPAGDGTFTRTVEGEEIVDDVSHWIVKSGRSRIYFVKSGLAWHFEKRDDETVLRRDPPVGYDWPVRVGKSWVHEYQREEPAAGKSARVYRRCLAVDEATITVPAGTFPHPARRVQGSSGPDRLRALVRGRAEVSGEGANRAGGRRPLAGTGELPGHSGASPGASRDFFKNRLTSFGVIRSGAVQPSRSYSAMHRSAKARKRPA